MICCNLYQVYGYYSKSNKVALLINHYSAIYNHYNDKYMHDISMPAENCTANKAIHNSGSLRQKVGCILFSAKILPQTPRLN